VLQAGILPNPQVSCFLETPVGEDTSKKVNAFGLGVEWDVTSLVARSSRVTAARSHADSIDMEIAWKEWRVAEAAKLHVYRLIVAEKRLALAKAAKRIAKSFYETLEKGVVLGVKTAQQLSSAQMTLHKAQTDCMQAQSEVNTDQLELKRVLGLPNGKKIKVEGSIPLLTVESVPPEPELIKDIEKKTA